MRRTIFSATGIAALGLSVALVSPASAVPTTDQVQSGQSGSTAEISYVFNEPPVFIGSTFTAGLSGTLSKIEIPYLSISNAGQEPYLLSVWPVDGSGLPIVSGAYLAEQQLVNSAYPTTSSPGVISVEFQYPATVAAGTQYAFTLGYNAIGLTSLNIVLDKGTTASSDKQMVTVTNGVAVRSSSYGINFATYVEQASPPPGGGGGANPPGGGGGGANPPGGGGGGVPPTPEPSDAPVATPTAAELPKTGADSASVLAVSLPLLAGGVAAVVLIRALRRRQQTDQS